MTHLFSIRYQAGPKGVGIAVFFSLVFLLFFLAFLPAEDFSSEFTGNREDSAVNFSRRPWNDQLAAAKAVFGKEDSRILLRYVHVRSIGDIAGGEALRLETTFEFFMPAKYNTGSYENHLVHFTDEETPENSEAYQTAAIYSLSENE